MHLPDLHTLLEHSEEVVPPGRHRPPPPSTARTYHYLSYSIAVAFSVRRRCSAALNISLTAFPFREGIHHAHAHTPLSASAGPFSAYARYGRTPQDSPSPDVMRPGASEDALDVAVTIFTDYFAKYAAKRMQLGHFLFESLEIKYGRASQDLTSPGVMRPGASDVALNVAVATFSDDFAKTSPAAKWMQVIYFCSNLYS
ncbi:hypothetical protein B0H11DRAFT_2324714 [Mycena galericulata]|nr:hypothetical protein B0H11DRAFT_2324714 [Mycena galericulata]